MNRHWCCTKFADRIRGTQKPKFATAKEWKEWREEAQKKYPFRYWLAEEFLPSAQRTFYWPYNKYQDILHYLYNRYITKSHALTSKLKKGKYNEFDERILHCLFDELVNFVEVEAAHMECLQNNKKIKWFYRSSEDGIAYLKQQAEDEPPYCEGSKEILELYYWWTQTYANRKDPAEISGLNDYCEKNKNFFDNLFENLNEENKKILDETYRIEQEQAEEEDEMLIRLIKARKYLWT